MYFSFVVVVLRTSTGRLPGAFLFRIALFAGFARLCGFDAALVIAFFARGFGFFAAVFSASNARAGQESHSAAEGGECFD